MNRRIIPLVAVVLFLGADAASAFDGDRKGFILGFGVGPSLTSIKQTVSGTGLFDGTSDRENKFGLGTSFRIGGAFNEQWMLYYANNVAWFGIENVLGDDVTIASSVGLVGVSYYLQPTKPSAYILGVIGVSTWDAIFEEGSSASTGFGIGGGMGWEFSPHWSFEALVEWGNPEDSDGGMKLETDAFSFMILIAATAY